MTVVSVDVLGKTGACPAEPNVLREMKNKKKRRKTRTEEKTRYVKT